MRRSSVLMLLAFLLLAAIMITTSLLGAKVECEVCVTYNGRTRCGTAAAPEKNEALRTATTAACATLTSGRAESMDCERIEPASSTCD